MKKLLKTVYHKLKNIYSNFNNSLNERKQFAFYKKLIGNNKLIFDVGANIGIKTELFYKLGNRVIAIEPQSDCYRALSEKFKNNPEVKTINTGVADKTGEATLNVSTKYWGFCSLKKDWQKGTKYDNFDKKEIIQLTTLENLISEYGLPDFCKIDVEGFEIEVLNGLKSKITCLNFEFHGDTFDQAVKCLDRLNELDYKMFNYVEGEGNFKIKNWVLKTELIKIIEQNIKTNKQIWGDIYAK
jgi:FkbM family methyltransferase